MGKVVIMVLILNDIIANINLFYFSTPDLISKKRNKLFLLNFLYLFMKKQINYATLTEYMKNLIINMLFALIYETTKNFLILVKILENNIIIFNFYGYAK
jgi:hypothetical protein